VVILNTHAGGGDNSRNDFLLDQIFYREFTQVMGITNLSTSSALIVDGGPMDIRNNFLSNIE